MLFALMQCWQSIPIVVGPLVLNAIFTATIDSLHGASYIFSAALMILPLLLIM